MDLVPRSLKLVALGVVHDRSGLCEVLAFSGSNRCPRVLSLVLSLVHGSRSCE